MAVSPDGAHLTAGLRYGEVKVWDTESWQLKHSWQQPGDDAWSVAFSGDSRTMNCGRGVEPADDDRGAQRHDRRGRQPRPYRP